MERLSAQRPDERREEKTMRSSNPFGTCAYCGKQIMWLRTKAGRNMPVDPTMVNYRKPEEGKKGREKIVTPVGEVISADRADGKEADGYGYISHFATCSNANKRRRR